MPYDEALADRVRALFAGRRDIVEVRMMGGLCFLLNGNMCCGVSRDALLVRTGKDGYAAAIAKAHARPMEFGGRRLGGFLFVDAPGIKTAAALRNWVGVGIAVATALPPKKPKAGVRKKPKPPVP